MELKQATADLVLEADDLVKERVDCPEWGLFLYIRTMTIKQRIAWEQHLVDEKNKADADGVAQEDRYGYAIADLIARTACDENGELLFSTDQAEVLAGKSSGAMQRCYDVSARLNYLTEDHMSDLVKNSESDQNDDSGSA